MVGTNHVNVQQKILTNFLPYIHGKVLDIATGTGFVAKYIKQKTESDVYGIDFCPDMIMMAQKNPQDVNFIIGDVHELPFEKHALDVIICSYGFYWFEDSNKVIYEINNALKPNGIFIVMEEEPKYSRILMPAFSRRGGYLKELAELENYVGIEALKRKIQNKGFKLIKELKLPIDRVHYTVGMVYQKS